MTVLVTGASGVLGLHIAREAAAAGETVIALSTSGAPQAAELVLRGDAERVQFVAADIRDFATVSTTIERFQVTDIVHSAALTGEALARAKPKDMFDVNVGGTANLLEAARLANVRRLIYVGSSAEYGARSDLRLITEEEVDIQGLYAETKYLGHRAAMRYRDVFGLDAVTARVSSVYGPNTRFNPHRGLVGNTLLAYLSREAAFGRPVSLGAGHDYTRAWTYAADAARGIVMLLRASELRHTAYNVAAGILYRLPDVMNALRVAAPGAVVEAQAAMDTAPQSSATRGLLDVSRAERDVGFKPEFDLAAGLQAYIEWWRALGDERAGVFAS